MGRDRLPTRRLCALTAAAIAVALCAAPASAEPRHTRATYAVPVTQPDQLGREVLIDTDVYLPASPAPPGGRPLVLVFHGGGSHKANEFDMRRAALFADHGYAAILYSQRGHGSSGGLTAAFGPLEMRDIFDLLAWALGMGGRDAPAHPDFGIDRARIGLFGYSQGGAHTNLGQVYSGEPSLNPYGIRFRAIQPGNTPDLVREAVVPGGVVKLSFGVGLIKTFYADTQGRVAPVVAKWLGSLAADVPALAGAEICQRGEPDTPTSTTNTDLAFRSVGCHPDAITVPSFWSQAFDDALFPAAMAISMQRRIPSRGRSHLYLDMGGHGAPGVDPAIETAKLRDQLAFFDRHLAGRRAKLPPRVTYWRREPTVPVDAKANRYPPGAWARRTANRWPPPGTGEARYGLGADGRAVQGHAVEGSVPLQPVSEHAAEDPVLQSAFAATPLGTSPLASVPASGLPGFIAGFSSEPLESPRELDGAPIARLAWTPVGADSQLVLKVFDQAPDGRLTLLSRGVRGLRNQSPGARQSVSVTGDAFSAVLHTGHRAVFWVSAGDVPFYKPYPSSAGGTLEAGDASTVSLPLRSLAPPRKG